MKKWIQVLIWVLFLAVLSVPYGIGGVYTNWLWFQSLGYSSVYWTILSTKIWIVAIVGAVFFILAFVNVRFAMGRSEENEENAEEEYESGHRRILEHLGGIFIIGILAISLFVGLTASSGWDAILRYSNKTDFGILDPIFAKDIGFYVFALPFYEFVWNGLFYGLLLIAVMTLVIYVLQGKTILLDQETENIAFAMPRFSSRAMAHLSLLGALILLVMAWGYRLSMYKLLYSARGVVFGATYADMHAQLPVLKLLIAISIFGALCLFVNMKYKSLNLPLVAVGLLIVVSILGGGVYPNIIQQYRVLPNEIDLETPYIKLNIN
jgi:hypothetical protein